VGAPATSRHRRRRRVRSLYVCEQISPTSKRGVLSASEWLCEGQACLGTRRRAGCAPSTAWVRSHLHTSATNRAWGSKPHAGLERRRRASAPLQVHDWPRIYRAYLRGACCDVERRCRAGFQLTARKEDSRVCACTRISDSSFKETEKRGQGVRCSALRERPEVERSHVRALMCGADGVRALSRLCAFNKCTMAHSMCAL
jgi:hypothetical protein